MYYAHLGDMQGARQCEELTNESVMLNQMAKSKFAPPQPNKPIRDVQDWKRIRNVLLEQQNWDLALEVSNSKKSSTLLGQVRNETNLFTDFDQERFRMRKHLVFVGDAYAQVG